jgi:hypothetical protein
MAVLLTTVTGNLETLLGTTPSLSRVWFELNRPDWNAAGDIFAKTPVEVVADAAGAFSVPLQSTVPFLNGAVYSAVLKYRNTVTGLDEQYLLASFAVPGSGPVELSDLLVAGVVPPVPVDVLAFALAAQVSATASAAAALISANLAAAFPGGPEFSTQAIYSADTGLTYTPAQPGTVVAGNSLIIGGIDYVVVASADTVFTLQNVNLVKVLLRPGERLAFPVPAGLFTAVDLGVWSYTAKGAFRYELQDTAGGRNDERGYGSGAASANWETDPANIGLLSFSFGRGNLTKAYLSTAFGHSNSAYGIAGIAGGAGSSTGLATDQANPFNGYCCFAVGKNVQAGGEKSFALNEETRALGRASGAVGFASVAGASTVAHGSIISATTVADEGIGAFAGGYGSIAYGDGAVAMGYYTVSYGSGLTIGRGINPGSPLVNVVPYSVVLGANVTRATLEVLPGPGTTTGVGKVRLRTATEGTPGGLEVADYNGVVRSAIKSLLTNSGSGQSWDLSLSAWITGALTQVAWAGYSTTKGFFPTTTADTRLGDAAYRWSHVFLSNAPDVSSDARLKNDIADLSAAELAAAGYLRTKRYVLKSTGEHARGYIAQDIIAAYEFHGLCAIKSGLVSMGPDGLYGVNYSAVESVRAEYLRSRLDPLQDINGKD